MRSPPRLATGGITMRLFTEARARIVPLTLARACFKRPALRLPSDRNAAFTLDGCPPTILRPREGYSTVQDMVPDLGCHATRAVRRWLRRRVVTAAIIPASGSNVDRGEPAEGDRRLHGQSVPGVRALRRAHSDDTAAVRTAPAPRYFFTATPSPSGRRGLSRARRASWLALAGRATPPCRDAGSRAPAAGSRQWACRPRRRWSSRCRTRRIGAIRC